MDKELKPKGSIKKESTEIQLSQANDNVALTKDLDLKSFDALSIINSPSLLDFLAKSKLIPPNSKKEDMIGAIITGHEFGISPMKSILLMNILTPGNAVKITKGLSLGMDIIESTESIYHFDLGGKKQLIVGANGVMGVLRRHKIDFVILDNATPIYTSIVASGKFKGSELTEELTNLIKPENLYMITTTTTQEVINSLKVINSNIVFYTKDIKDRVTRVKFKRENCEEHIAEYRLSQAKDAGLTTKDNWKDIYIMMQHRAMGRGARFIAGDVLGQVYLPGEQGDNSINDLKPLDVQDTTEITDSIEV